MVIFHSFLYVYQRVSQNYVFVWEGNIPEGPKLV